MAIMSVPPTISTMNMSELQPGTSRCCRPESQKLATQSASAAARTRKDSPMTSAIPIGTSENENIASDASRAILLSEYFASPPSRSRSAYGSTTVL